MKHAYIGNGKGKTTAAIGLAIRAFGTGWRCCLIFFDKGGESYNHGESAVFRTLGIDHHYFGCDRALPKGGFRFGTTREDKEEAAKGVSKAEELISSGKYDLVVLDEFITAFSYSLISEEQYYSLLSKVPDSVELIMTGRCTDEKSLEKVDLISRIEKVRHYFDKGTTARPGIEF